MEQTNIFLNYVLSALLKKVIVPSDYHSQVKVVKEMLKNDSSGLVDSLTDFAVQTASVDYRIETKNDNLNEILNNWLQKINTEYNGKIPSGIAALGEEYYKERWKSSSFPVLKIGKWEKVDGLWLPTRLYFLDGESIHAKDKENSKDLRLLSYDYYLGDPQKKNKLDKDVVFSKPYARWFDKYPVPYLIKRGIYLNYRVINAIKNKEIEILEQIIPYMLLVKKGTEGLAINKIKNYSQDDLNKILEQFQTLVDEIKSTSTAGDKRVKSPIRVSQFDEELKHLIPDLSSIFNKDLFAEAERNILSGMGFIDVIDALSTTRRESVLNPKGFIEEINKGVKDFKRILNSLMLMIQEKNKGNTKYMNVKYSIISSPITGFMTADFKDKLRMLWIHGQLSNRTYCELVGEVDFETEVSRRKQEAKDGIEIVMYPHQKENREADVSTEEMLRQKMFDMEEEDEDGNPVLPDRTDDTNKEKFDKSAKDDLEGAPYKTVKDLDPKIRKALSPELRSIFIRVFNDAYETYNNESRAFRVAWSVIKKIARKNKKGIWVRKRKRINGKLEPLKITKSMISEVLDEEEGQAIKEELELKKLELLEKQNQLADKLLKNKEKK